MTPEALAPQALPPVAPSPEPVTSGTRHPTRRHPTSLGRRPGRRWERPAVAASTAIVAAILIVIGFQPAFVVDQGPDPQPKGRVTAGDSAEGRAVVKAETAVAVQRRTDAARPRRVDAFDTSSVPGSPAFLRRVSGPELEALIDLWDAEPAGSSSLSI